ncbi:hypothetical protein [Streptomyces sp. NPDC048521]|uniref:hypothetical protein n=1 Tax=Streptomyces sp. NPDC048521 TaxID=3365566 RepID=UPI00371A11D6
MPEPALDELVGQLAQELDESREQKQLAPDTTLLPLAGEGIGADPDNHLIEWSGEGAPPVSATAPASGSRALRGVVGVSANPRSSHTCCWRRIDASATRRYPLHSGIPERLKNASSISRPAR